MGLSTNLKTALTKYKDTQPALNKHTNELADVDFGALLAGGGTVGSGTLTLSNSTQSTLVDSSIKASSLILFFPQDVLGAGLSASHSPLSNSVGSSIVNHSAAAGTEKFSYVVIGDGS